MVQTEFELNFGMKGPFSSPHLMQVNLDLKNEFNYEFS